MRLNMNCAMFFCRCVLTNSWWNMNYIMTFYRWELRKTMWSWISTWGWMWIWSSLWNSQLNAVTQIRLGAWRRNLSNNIWKNLKISIFRLLSCQMSERWINITKTSKKWIFILIKPNIIGNINSAWWMQKFIPVVIISIAKKNTFRGVKLYILCMIKPQKRKTSTSKHFQSVIVKNIIVEFMKGLWKSKTIVGSQSRT